MIASDGCEICKCDTVETCPDGQVKVKNYIDGIGACGEVCCEWKEDYYYYYEKGFEYGVYKVVSKDTDYQVSGAINNSCCGGYRYYYSFEQSGDAGSEIRTARYDYQIFINGGRAYCAKPGDTTFNLWSTTTSYPDVGTYHLFSSLNGKPYMETTCTSDIGDPEDGECVNIEYGF